MRLLTANMVHVQPGDQLFRESRIRVALFALTGAAFMIGGWMWTDHARGGARLPAFGLVVFGVFWSVIGLSMLRAALRPTSWLMIIRGGRLLVHFRTAMNNHFDPAEPTVIQVERSEIEAFRLAGAVRRTGLPFSSRPNQRSEGQTYLDLILQDDVPATIRDALRIERLHPPVGGWMKSQTKAWPVRVEEDRVLRLTWRNAATWISPNAKSAAQALSNFFAEQPKVKSNEDFSPATLRALPEADRRQRYIELARLDPLQASFTLQRVEGCSATEAHERVEQLQKRSD